jgi:hypothetical protein
VAEYYGPPTIFSDFQRWCPRLRSLQMSVDSNFDGILGVVLGTVQLILSYRL